MLFSTNLAVASLAGLAAIADCAFASTPSHSTQDLHRRQELSSQRHHRGLVQRSRSALSAMKRDASTVMSNFGAGNTEGEDHGPIKVPRGSEFTSLPVGSQGDEVGVYWSRNPVNKTATHAFVMIHGKLRDGDNYWSIMNTALTQAVQQQIPGADNNSIIVAPEFFSTKLNSGQYTKNMLAWGDTNAWQAGEIADHPSGTQTSGFDVLDAFVAHFADATAYPQMKNITLVGHGGGGQMMQRYAVVAHDPPSSVHVRYLYGDASSSVYFGTERPVVPARVARKSDCPTYNTWRYGFENFTSDVDPTSTMTPIQYFAQYIKRDVVELIGLDDTARNGDQYCMAQLQGGVARRDRNLAYWKYINTLARTNFDMTGFNATFDADLPDWSNVSGNVIAHRLIIVENATHSAAEVFGSQVGRAALFESGTLPTGWRPQGWNPAGNGQRLGAASNGSSASSGGSNASTASSKSSGAPSLFVSSPLLAFIVSLSCVAFAGSTLLL